MKKIVFSALIILIGFSGFAQKNKFGHVNTAEIFESMSERNTAQVEVENFARQLEEQLTALNGELEQKYTVYQQNAETMPTSVRETKEKELADLQQRIQKFQVTAQTDLQTKEQELLEPIYNKIKEAIKLVGEQDVFLYIYDESTLLYFSSESVDLTEKVKLKLKSM